jgi:hypothetical protein
MAGVCEHGNEPSGSGKGEEFVVYVSDYLVSQREGICFI